MTMAILNTAGMQRKPTHPGEMLREDFIPELLRERRAVSPEMALRLARLFGNSPEFWLNAQRAVDLWTAAQSIKEEVDQIKPLNVA
jgi:plasmid maintenance system antidote protein VapI